jgi:hypothetical protein
LDRENDRKGGGLVLVGLDTRARRRLVHRGQHLGRISEIDVLAVGPVPIRPGAEVEQADRLVLGLTAGEKVRQRQPMRVVTAELGSGAHQGRDEACNHHRHPAREPRLGKTAYARIGSGRM